MKEPPSSFTHNPFNYFPPIDRAINRVLQLPTTLKQNMTTTTTTLLAALSLCTLAALNLRADDPVLPIPSDQIKDAEISAVGDGSIYRVTAKDGTVYTGHTVSRTAADGSGSTITVPDEPGGKETTAIRYNNGNVSIIGD